LTGVLRSRNLFNSRRASDIAVICVKVTQGMKQRSLEPGSKKKKRFRRKKGIQHKTLKVVPICANLLLGQEKNI